MFFLSDFHISVSFWSETAIPWHLILEMKFAKVRRRADARPASGRGIGMESSRAHVSEVDIKGNGEGQEWFEQWIRRGFLQCQLTNEDEWRYIIKLDWFWMSLEPEAKLIWIWWHFEYFLQLPQYCSDWVTKSSNLVEKSINNVEYTNKFYFHQIFKNSPITNNSVLFKSAFLPSSVR